MDGGPEFRGESSGAGGGSGSPCAGSRRAWFVSTDIDPSSMYVGASSAAIARLSADDLLEVLPAHPEDEYDGPPCDPEEPERS